MILITQLIECDFINKYFDGWKWNNVRYDCNWISEWLLFDAKLAIFQLYHGENKLHSMNDARFVLDQHAELDFYNARTLKQQSVCGHVAPLWHIILIPSQPIFAPTP